MTGYQASHARPPGASVAWPATSSNRVLVVDDDSVLRLLSTEVLVSSGCQVDTAEDGEAGWEALHAKTYDLLITDNNMPRLSGVELVRKLRSENVDLPVIMVSGEMPTEELNRHPWLHVTATLRKPFTGNELLATVKGVLHETFMLRPKRARLPMHSSTRVFPLIIAVVAVLAMPGTAQVFQSPVPPQSSTSAQQVPGRLQPAYQVFAHQIALPSITPTTNGLLVIGDTARLDIAHRDQMLAQLKPLSEQFGMPASALETILKGLNTNGQPAASELQARLIDYKYLLERWTHYYPPAGQEILKTNALQLLQAGELDQVWRMFNSLPRPKPPTELRLVGSGS